MPNVSIINPIWIDQASDASAILDEYATRDVIAVDTEFMRTVTFLPVPAVVQIGDGEKQFLLAAEAVEKAQAAEFFRAFQEDAIIVAHAAREDMEVFECVSGIGRVNVFDTQIAAGFAGLEPTLSLQRIVQQLLDIELSKTESRTDWLQRPLTSEQIDYAAADIAYLIDVYHELKQRLQENGRLAWALEDCQKRLHVEIPEPEDYYLSYNNVWQLNNHQLAKFKQVVAWRERYARDNDIARTRIAKDFILFNCVKHAAHSRDALRLEGMHPQAVRKYGYDLLEVLESKAEEIDFSDVQIRRPLSKPQQGIVKLMRKLIAEKAHVLAIDPQVIASSKHCVALFYWYIENRVANVANEAPLPELFSGWRYDGVTMPLIALLDAHVE